MASFSRVRAISILPVLTLGLGACAGDSTDSSGDADSTETSGETAGETGGSGDGDGDGDGADPELDFTLQEATDDDEWINDVVIGWEESQFVAGIVADPDSGRARRGKIKMYYDEMEAWEDFVEGTGPCFATCSSANGITTEPAMGDVIAVGGIKHPDAMGGLNSWIQRYNWMGTIAWTGEWTNPAEASGEDTYFDAAFDPANGDIVAVGYSEEAGLFDMMIARYDGMGNELWRTFHSGAGIASLDIAYGVDVASDGTAYVVGREEVDAASGGTGIWIGSFDATGTMGWSDRVDGPGSNFDLGTGIELSADESSLAVSGRVDADPPERDNIWVAVYDPDGTRNWEVQLTHASHESDCPSFSCDAASAIAWRADGHLAVAGGQSSSRDDRSSWLGVLDGANGDVLWERTMDGDVDGADYAAGIAVDEAQSLVVGGQLVNEATGVDWWFAKWTPVLP